MDRQGLNTNHTPQTGWCRQCAASVAPGITVCGECGNARLLRHDEAATLAIAHLDCDAFYAAIEKRDDPRLADLPVIVGGGDRGVVTTACYIARRTGVRSAMPMVEARRRCPEAVIIRPDMAKYARESRRIRAHLDGLTPVVHTASIDEAYLDMRGTTRLHGAPPIARLITVQQAIAADVGITVSIGLSYARYLAKIASEQDKPNGFFVIGHADAATTLSAMDVRALPGIGPVAADKLRARGFHRLGDIQSASVQELTTLFGERGAWLSERAHGRGPAWPDTKARSHSVSAETTFRSDLAFGPDLVAQLHAMSVRCADRLKEKGLAGHTVVLKLKTRDHRILTRRTRISEPTQRASRLFEATHRLLQKEAAQRPRQPYRLIGVGVDEVMPFTGEVFDPFDESDARDYARETAVDALRARFGTDILQTGRGFSVRPTKREDKAP